MIFEHFNNQLIEKLMGLMMAKPWKIGDFPGRGRGFRERVKENEV